MEKLRRMERWERTEKGLTGEPSATTFPQYPLGCHGGRTKLTCKIHTSAHGWVYVPRGAALPTGSRAGQGCSAPRDWVPPEPAGHSIPGTPRHPPPGAGSTPNPPLPRPPGLQRTPGGRQGARGSVTFPQETPPGMRMPQPWGRTAGSAPLPPAPGHGQTTPGPPPPPPRALTERAGVVGAVHPAVGVQLEVEADAHPAVQPAPPPPRAAPREAARPRR